MKLKAVLAPIACISLLCMAIPVAGAQSSSSATSPESLASAQYQADLKAANPDGTIPNRYVVTLSEMVPRLDELGLEQQVQALLARVGGGEILALYDRVLYGFAVRIPEEKAALLKALPWVATIEPAQLMTLSATAGQDSPPNWGLDRIDQEDKTLDKKYYYPSTAGEGVHVFILDTGIRSTHQDFAGRLRAGKSFVPGRSSTEDCDGHGTHVAGIAVGTTYGVAKKAFVYPVAVSPCPGESSSTDVAIQGLNWVAKQVTDYGKKPAVINMSIGATDLNKNPVRNNALDTAVRKAVTDDISVVVAAGNSNADACKGSPAAEPKVLTVASTDKNDKRRSDSSYGSCVDLFAPGDAIVSASHQSDSGSANKGGTSMAAPHVAGAMAIWRGINPSFSAEIVQNGLTEYLTTRDKVTDPGTGSPNKLLRIVVDKPPKAAFTGSCSILNLKKTCTFDASGSTDDQQITSYQWDFGGGATATGVVATYAFPMLSQQQITLTVTDNAEQTGTVTQSLLVIGVLP